MAYLMAYGKCFGCGRIFGFNPDLVPALRVRWVPDPDDPDGGGDWVDDADADPQPLCGVCVTVANPQRTRNGLAPIPVPPGAYEPGEA
jgi:hypothetical protein